MLDVGIIYTTSYFVSIIIFIVIPMKYELSRDRIIALSVIPSLLIGACSSVYVFITDGFFSIVASFFLMFVSSYCMMLPHLLIVALCVEYIKKYYEPSIVPLAILGGVLGAILAIVPFVSLEFSFIALVLGVASVWIQYYFTERKDAHVTA